MSSFWQSAEQLKNNGESFVVVTVIKTLGSAPQDAGAKAIVTKVGLHFGTVGGGKVEARAISHAQQILALRQNCDPQLVTWNLQRDIGMTCGGEITYLFEFNNLSAWKIAVFGAGHVSQALCRLLINLNCQITCIDSRPEWIEKLPQAANLKTQLIDDPVAAAAELSADHYFVVMTQGHATDMPILKALYSNYPQAPFIGAIGSQLKGRKLKKDLHEYGITEDILKKFQCPIGLNIGTNHPYEIAISVSAQLLQRRDQQLLLILETDLKFSESTLSEML